MAKVKLDTALVWVALLLLVFACITPSFQPASIASPTSFSHDDLSTLVAQTAGAAQIQTASALPTITQTSTSTRIPTLTPTFTPTFIYQLRTDTPLPTETSAPAVGSIIIGGNNTATANQTATAKSYLTGRQWTCLVTGSKPPRDIPRKPGRDFYITWIVMNTGTETWSNNDIDFIYESGYRTEQRQIQDLPLSIVTGASINLKVLLTAPTAPGTYNVIWDLKVGNTVFCRMQIDFLVK